MLQRSPTVKLKLRKPKSDKKVKWTEETVDNENMGKKKSKCKNEMEYCYNSSLIK